MSAMKTTSALEISRARQLLPRLSAPITVKCLLATLAVLVVVDGLLTNLLVAHGIAREGNPFLQSLAGGWALVAVKAVGAFACVFILWDVYRHWRGAGLFAIYSFVLVYTVIVAWNGWLLVTGI